MSVNKWIGIGNLTKDVLLKYTPAGIAVCSFSIACNERYKDKDGNKQEKVEFINLVAWRQLAEICGKFLSKGKQVYVEGKIQNRSYDDKDGIKRYVSEVVINEMQMLGSKPEGRSNRQPAQQQSQQNNNQAGPRESQYQQQRGGFEEPVFDDGEPLPF